RGLKTSELLNVTFRNVSSLTSLTIKNYNFTLFPNKPFRELVNLSELYIIQGKLRVLPEDLFYNLNNLTKLDLYYNDIESVHPLVFRNLVKLEYLELGWNRLKDLPSDTLNGLSHLRTFCITNNRQLSEIPPGFFKKLFNLNEFYARFCSISSLEKDVFYDLINLKIVSLNSNRIEHLPPNLLKNNKLLTRFSCSFNKIAKLPTGIFHGLSELQWLSLRKNSLENLPEDVFQNLSSLETLILSENRLTFLHENLFLPLTKLKDLDLSENNLTKIIGEHPFGSSKHLRTLALYNAGLTQWPLINWSEYNFTEVILSNNHFETVKLPIYTPNHVKILLSNCKIRTIYVDEWKYGFQMPIYHLNNNKITCDHKLQQFNFTLTSNREIARKMFPNIEKTKCYGEERNLLDDTSFVVIGNYFPMNCDCSAQDNLVMLNCSGKGIDRIPEVLLPNATIVDLRWLLRNSQKIADFSDVFCARNSSSVTFTEIVSNDRCTQILEDNLAFSVNVSCAKCVFSDEVSSVLGWKIAVAILTSLMKCRFNVTDVIIYRVVDVATVRISTIASSEFCFILDSFLRIVLVRFVCRCKCKTHLDEMRWVIFSQFLFLVVNSCQEFWQHWGNVSCMSLANSCDESKNFSRVQIFDRILSIKCGAETIDSGLMRCLDVRKVQDIKFTDCYLSGIDFGIFTFGYEIEHVKIWYKTYRHNRNFESASFNDMSSLRSVDIQNVKTSELFNLTFHKFPSLNSLKIEGYNFTLFPNRPFRELINLSELYIMRGNLTVLPEDLFYNLHKLTQLDLSDNKIQSIHPLVFRNLIKLDILSLNLIISDNRKLSEIPSGFFKKLHNLTVFSALGCSLSSLEDDVFSDLINLKYVGLSFNRIEHLPPNLLRNNKRLTQFSCSYNKISTLPARIFHGLSELRELDLAKNRLENLSEDVFRNLSSLQKLDLSENRLKFLPENIFLSLSNLTRLDLSKNNLTKLTGERPFGSSKYLRTVRLNNASLTQWPVINWTEYDLTKVDFSNNHFETVKLPIYTQNHMHVYLLNSKIRTIYLDEWKYGFQMPIYYIISNEINCDRELQQFVSVFKSNREVAKKMFPNIEKTKCYGEERNLLDNTSLVVIGNYCPIECDCSAQLNHLSIVPERESTEFPKFSSRMPRLST
ncbi:slit homolog 3 protein-like, partial [Centruroides sculpturatus]|uniref:slit homolog 3 protein-like n=1 Tax=Centruroides sculpturatus TaxID=218467 RepID=UPI000C6E558A